MFAIHQNDTADFATDARYRDRNWAKHRKDPAFDGFTYEHAAEFMSYDGKRFPRAVVFEHFAHSDRMGIISAIKWGYPKGSLPGGRWNAFSTAFRSDKLVEHIQALRANPRPASETIAYLNSCIDGLGTATTTKIAHFAGLVTSNGQRCMIYDSMVRRAIRAKDYPEFNELAAIIRRSDRDLTPKQQEQTYGLYLDGLHRIADATGATPDAVELTLFLAGREEAPL